MRKHWILSLALAFAASVASAAPKITSITPNSGPAAGGTVVTIRGSDFQLCDNCSPAIPLIYFGNTRAQFGNRLSETTIEVVTPPHFAGAVDVTVYLSNGSDTVANGFVFTGSAESAFERILLPILTPPVDGAYGSRFETTFSAFNTSNQMIPIEGLTRFCDTLCPVNPVEVEPSRDLREDVVLDLTGTPGRFIYLRRSEAESLSMNLRVQDVSRDALNFGTEIPVVRWSEVRPGPLTLTGIPVDSRFRQALRIYSTEEMIVLVSVGGIHRPIILQRGRDDFEPAYGVFDDFPVGRVVITPLSGTAKFWAFVTVTNNETQAITTISPQ
jgi:hypothetical protein